VPVLYQKKPEIMLNFFCQKQSGCIIGSQNMKKGNPLITAWQLVSHKRRWSCLVQTVEMDRNLCWSAAAVLLGTVRRFRVGPNTHRQPPRNHRIFVFALRLADF